MKGQILPLSIVRPGKSVTLVAITAGRGLRARLTDMGLTAGIRFRVIQIHRLGACIIAINHARLVLGHGMAQKIMVRED
jgi:ferrous iron transport protein A